MPLVMLNALPGGQVVVDIDAIVAIVHTGTQVEIVLRDCGHRVFLPHSTVADAAADLRNPENVVMATGSSAKAGGNLGDFVDNGDQAG
jgi:hypothetical protein